MRWMFRSRARERLWARWLAGLALVLLAGPALAESRMALVIGIDTYQHLPALQKAKSDADAVAAALKGLGFEVDLLLDSERRDLNRGISNFVHKITPGATVYVHFSGHGVEIDNDTYLLPADMPVPKAGDKDFVKSEAVRLSGLLDQLKGASARARVLSIDACRDNPFAKSGTRSIGGAQGIAVLPAPRGTLVMYSAAQGQTALDRLGPDDAEATSVYTRVLLKHLTRTDLSMVDVAQEVRRGVETLAASVGHEQRPAYYDELSDRLFLAGGGSSNRLASVQEQGQRPVALVPPAPPPATAFCESGPEYDKILLASGVDRLRAYLQRCNPGGPYRALAAQEFESRLFASTAECIRRSPGCNLDGCVGAYEQDLPTGARLSSLRDLAARTVASRAVCRTPLAAEPGLPAPRASEAFETPAWCLNDKRKTPIEALICSDGGLGALDERLNRLYARRRDSLSGSARTQFVRATREWVAARDERCGGGPAPRVKACLVAAMQERIREIGP